MPTHRGHFLDDFLPACRDLNADPRQILADWLATHQSRPRRYDPHSWLRLAWLGYLPHNQRFAWLGDWPIGLRPPALGNDIAELFLDDGAIHARHDRRRPDAPPIRYWLRLGPPSRLAAEDDSLKPFLCSVTAINTNDDDSRHAPRRGRERSGEDPAVANDLARHADFTGPHAQSRGWSGRRPSCPRATPR
jgi:hypothetical protein